MSRPFTYQSKTANQPDMVEAILDYLQDKRGNIEPFQLQLLCRHIELKVIENQAKVGELVIVDLQSYLGGQEGMDKVIKRFYQKRRQFASRLAGPAEGPHFMRNRLVKSGRPARKLKPQTNQAEFWA